MTYDIKFSSDEFPILHELAYEVIQSLEGTKSSDKRIYDVQHLALKIFFHSASAYYLLQGTNVASPSSIGDGEISFIDPGSIVVLSRSALETYLTFFEVYINPSNDDEFEFNYCLWHLSGISFLENYEPIIETPEEKIEEMNSQIEHFRDRIASTDTFSKLKKGKQHEVLKGIRRRDWKEVASSADIGYKFVRMVYKYYSGFVHSDGFTSKHLFSAESLVQQKNLGGLHFKIIMIALSKFILDYSSKFKKAKIILEDYPKAYQIAQGWAEIASRI